jgi:hypothetical protein
MRLSEYPVMVTRIDFGSPRIAPDQGVVDALVDGQQLICHFAREVVDRKNIAWQPHRPSLRRK